MKGVKFVGLIVLAMLLAACEALPTERLTMSMGAELLESTEQGASIDSVEVAVTECSGEWNPESNMLRVSFQLERDQDIFGTNSEELSLFGGGTMLMGTASAEPSGNFRFRCEGPAEMTALAFKFDQVTNSSSVFMPIIWKGILSVPQLTVESPSGATNTLESVPIHGLLAPSAADIPEMIGAAYDLYPNNVSYQSYFAAQKALYENYPDAAIVREAARNDGLSARNAARLGQLYVEQDVERQQALLLDMLTSAEDEEYAEIVVGSTVQTLRAMGLDFQTISNLFEEETEGRVAIQFNDDAESATASDLDVQITNRDGADSAVFTVSTQGDSGSDEDGGSPSGSEGGGTGSEGGGTSSEGGGTDGEGGGTDGGNDGGTDGGNGGGTGGGFWGKLVDILWGALKGAAGGAVAGGIAGSPFGPAGNAVGGAIGAIIGAAHGGYHAGQGVYDPAPNDPNSPCKSPIAFC